MLGEVHRRSPPPAREKKETRPRATGGSGSGHGYPVDVDYMYMYQWVSGGLGACPQAGVSKGAAAPLALFWVRVCVKLASPVTFIYTPIVSASADECTVQHVIST